jgi:hypothetical protein
MTLGQCDSFLVAIGGCGAVGYQCHSIFLIAIIIVIIIIIIIVSVATVHYLIVEFTNAHMTMLCHS